MQPPLLTIAISTYNRAEGYFREALASALAQTYAPLEILIVDNASTDATSDLVASVSDDRIRYVRHEKNIGPNNNFNACLQLARGSYFLLLHDDDRIDDDFADYCMSALEQVDAQTPPGLIRTGVRVVDAEGRVQSEKPNLAKTEHVDDLVLAWFAGETSMYFCNTIFRTEVLREVDGFHSPRDLYVDVAAVVRIAARHPVLDLPDVKVSFRRHGGNNGGAQSIQAWCDDAMYIIDLMADCCGRARRRHPAAWHDLFHQQHVHPRRSSQGPRTARSCLLDRVPVVRVPALSLADRGVSTPPAHARQRDDSVNSART